MNFSDGPLFERLEVVDDCEPHSAALNMAVDEILLNGLTDVPRLRVYHWERLAVSFGCFEPIAPVQAAYPERDLVRRWTGGGVVEHGADVTYSLFIPRSLPLAAVRPGESYRLIHTTLEAALRQIGIEAQLEKTSRGAISRSCFENPVSCDVLIDGHKVAGAAQRRTRHGLLHQGSILRAHAPELANGRNISDNQLVNALMQHFGRRRDCRELCSQELSDAELLASAKYGSARWLRRF